MEEPQDLDDFGVATVAWRLGLFTSEVTFCDRKTNIHVFKSLISDFYAICSNNTPSSVFSMSFKHMSDLVTSFL